MDDIREQLLRKAYLYADTDAYRAGVDAALTAMVQVESQPALHMSESAPVGSQDPDAALLTLSR